MKPPQDHTGAAFHADDSEGQLIAAMIEGGPAIKFLPDILAIVPSSEPFSTPERKVAWNAILQLHRKRIPVAIESVTEELLRQQTVDDPKQVALELATTHALNNAEMAIWHAQQVQTAYERREAGTALQAALDAVSDGARDPSSLMDYLGQLQSRLNRAIKAGKRGIDLKHALMSASELATRELPPRKRLLANWPCEADLGFVFAPRGVGKTWLAMALPMALSQCANLGKWNAGEDKVRVLYVDGEMPLELTRYRSRGMSLEKGDVTYLHHELLFNEYGTSLNIGKEEHRQGITSLLVDGGYRCIILDNLSSLASGIDKNKGDAYEPIANWLLELRRRKITVIVIHHAGRNADVMRGHTKREDACSWIIQLRDAKTEGESGAKFITHFAKPSRNTGEPLPDLLWHFTTAKDGVVSIQCETAEVSEYEAFIQLVLDGVETQADIAEQMAKPKGTISKWAKKAAASGRIRRDGNKLLPPQAPKKPHHESGDD